MRAGFISRFHTLFALIFKERLPRSHQFINYPIHQTAKFFKEREIITVTKVLDIKHARDDSLALWPLPAIQNCLVSIFWSVPPKDFVIPVNSQV